MIIIPQQFARIAVMLVLGYAGMNAFGESSTSATTTTHIDDLWESRTLGPLPAISMRPRAATTAAEAEHIRSLIYELKELTDPEVGLCPTLMGSAFPPIPEHAHGSAMLLTDHHLKPSEAIRELVALGPKSIPYLLDAINATTPTKLVIHHDWSIGAMMFSSALDHNSLNTIESRVIGPEIVYQKDASGFLPMEAFRQIDFSNPLETYTVPIGDACFVALGEIVGRHYAAVSYMPTACIYLTSPGHNPKISQQLRATWSSPDASQHLFDSLCLDYAVVGWQGGNLQAEAALRLLYYFPEESSDLIAARLNRMQVQETASGQGVATKDSLERFRRREEANGLSTREFIEAVSWCDQPKIKQALQNIATRTDDSEILRILSARYKPLH